MNEAVALILTSGAGFRGKKLGLNRIAAIQSCEVALTGQLSNCFLVGLACLGDEITHNDQII